MIKRIQCAITNFGEHPFFVQLVDADDNVVDEYRVNPYELKNMEFDDNLELMVTTTESQEG